MLNPRLQKYWWPVAVGVLLFLGGGCAGISMIDKPGDFCTMPDGRDGVYVFDKSIEAVACQPRTPE